MSLPMEISVRDLKQQLDTGESIALIDVREVVENQISAIGGSQLIPMNSVPARLQQLDALADEKRLVVFCHHGMRSLNVVNWLRQQGVENCQSLAGGIDAWSLEIDPKVPRY